MQRKIRVLVGKPGLDGHDRGAKVVAAALRDAGMEVIYTGLHQMSAQVVEAALQEDVDVVALSILSGAHMTLFPEILALMRERGLGDRLLTGGGIIPPEDMETLAGMGVGKLFGPGSSTQDIVASIREWFASRHGADALTPLPPPRAPESFVPAGSEPGAFVSRRRAPASVAPRRKAATRRTPATRTSAKRTTPQRTTARRAPASTRTAKSSRKQAVARTSRTARTVRSARAKSATRRPASGTKPARRPASRKKAARRR